MKPRLLDLFCGAGGAARGYQLAGFHVTGVDHVDQPRYAGDEFVQADALTFPLEGFDAIHASPPCQAYSVGTKANGDPSSHPALIGPIRERLLELELPYAIENVPGAPLVNPVTLCGSSFNLGVRRHRLFETNFPLLVPSCAHGMQEKRYDIYEHGRWFKSANARVYGTGGGKAGEHWGEAMGIDWMTRDELKEAIPPVFTEAIGYQLMQHLRQEVAA